MFKLAAVNSISAFNLSTDLIMSLILGIYKTQQEKERLLKIWNSVR